MRIITLEEHTIDDRVTAAAAPTAEETPMGAFPKALADTLRDVDDQRITDMDANGIDVQVLSTLGAQQLAASVASHLVSGANDRMAAAITRHPDRFRAFASLPTADPAAAVRELERAVSDLGFVGAMVFGRTREFLDAEPFEPILAAAEGLDVPIYLHPAPAPRAITEWSYQGLTDQVSQRFQTSAWGWHQETAIHFLHLALAGVLDRHPGLQFVLGHWGEMIPFYLDRLDEQLPQSLTGLDRSFTEYLKQNVYITPSGMFSQAQLQFCVETVGVDRIMYAVDYPFLGNEKAEAFLAEARLTADEKDSIAHGTAEQVLGIRPRFQSICRVAHGARSAAAARLGVGEHWAGSVDDLEVTQTKGGHAWL